MIRERKWWVTYYLHHGRFFADTRSEDLPGYVLPGAVAWPDDAYAFEMWERVELVDDDGAHYKGEAHQVGPLFFHPDSEVQTLEQVEHDPRRTGVLLDNMRSNKWDRIVWSRWGNWPQTFDPDKAAVLPHASPEGP